MNFQHLNKPQSVAQAYGFSGRRMQRMRQLQQSVEEEDRRTTIETGNNDD